MRVAKALSSLVAVLVVTSSSAQETAPTLESMYEKLKANRSSEAELRKKIAALEVERAEIGAAAKKELERLTGLYKELVGPPVPLPPPPNDALKGRIATAFSADPGTLADKKADAVKLSGLYAAAVQVKLADDPTVTTVGQLIARVRTLGAQLAADRLPGTRKVIGDEMAAVLKDPTATLDKTSREAAALLFARIEAALDEVAK